MEKIMASDGGLDEIYNPKMKCTPKTKQIFKMEKFVSSTSSCGSVSEKPTDAAQFHEQFINPLGSMDELNKLRLFGNETEFMDL